MITTNNQTKKEQACEEVIQILIEARGISKTKGIDVIHILQALENKDKKIKATITHSVLLTDFYGKEKNRLIKKYKGDKISVPLKKIIIAHGKNYEEFFFAIIKTDPIKTLLEDCYAKFDKIKENYNKGILDSCESFSEESDLSSFNSLFSKEATSSGDSKSLPISSILSDLTQKAKNGELAKVVGREEELLDIYQILQRKTKSNPIIIGESGVGKTTIVEALAQKIAKNQVPKILKDKKILELDISSIFSGSKYEGELEKRLKKVIETLKKEHGQSILFIDNIHNIHANRQNKMNLADMLKPALSRSEITVIGATTNEHYKGFEEDASFARHFQTISIKQPSIPETISILRGLKSNYENHYKIKIEDSAIIQAVKLSDRYINNRNFPDKAIDIIDEASSIVRISLDSRPIVIQKLENKINQKELEKKSISLDGSEEAEFELQRLNKDLLIYQEDLEKILNQEKLDNKVLRKIAESESVIKELENKAETIQDLEDRMKFEEDNLQVLRSEMNMLKDIQLQVVVKKLTTVDILRVIAAKTGVPVDKMAKSDREKVLGLEENLRKNLIGQNVAVNAVYRAIKRSMAGLSDVDRPNGSFLFLGSSGVGKTELCKQLAYEMFGSKEAIIRMDMSEYMEKGTVSKLIGSPSGYKNADEGGFLTEAVRKKPYSIILFDEIEKADPEVLNLLLQVLDEGHLSDGKGRKINFKNTIVVLTSNIGSEHIKKNTPKEKAAVIRELEKKMRPELINRIDEKIIFETLDKDSLRKIAKLMVKPTIEKLADKRINLEITDNCLDLVVEAGYDPKYGARPLKRKIQTMIDDSLTDYILTGYLSKGSDIILDDFNGRVQLVNVVEG